MNNTRGKQFYILDDEGALLVAESFIKAHPDWYEYFGYFELNGYQCYSYRFRH